MPAEVVTIASEVLSGHTREANFQTIVRFLAREGMRVTRHVTVHDDRSAIGEALRQALARSEVVVATGGLGGTPDDLTRGAIAAVLGRKLGLREPLLEALRERFRARGAALPPAAEVMALLPAGARPLANRVGLAPGIHLEIDGRHLFALPGVPEEMEAMLAEQVVPELRRTGLGMPWPQITLRTVGVSETTLAQWVEPLLGEGVRTAYLPSAGRVDVRLEAAAGPGGQRALRETEERLRGRLGPALYGANESSLEAVVLQGLRQRGLTLGVAESLTGGALGGALTRVPGSSAVFRGDLVAYGNEAKESLLGVSSRILETHGAVSGETARAMAAGARRAFAASVAVSTTGIAGPDGGTAQKPVGLVYCGLSTPQSNVSFRFQFGGGREMIQDRSVTLALNVLWLHMQQRLDCLDAQAACGGPADARG